MRDKITMSEVLAVWEESFKAGYAAHESKPWIDPNEAFMEWWQEEERKQLKL